MSTTAWHLPLIAVGVGFHLAVSWALLWRYLQARERSLLTWGLAWMGLSLHVVGMYLTHTGAGPAAMLLRDVTLAGASLALFVGQAEREGRPFQKSSALISALLLLVLGVGIGVVATPGLVARAAVVLFMGGAAWLSQPVGTLREELPRWLLTAGYAVSTLHGLTYLFPRQGPTALPVEIAGHALFSLLFSAAVTWQTWEYERALRFFSTTLERMNRPLTTREALDEALLLVTDALHADQGWIMMRDDGAGDASGGWTLAASLGFPEWTRHGLDRPVFSIGSYQCLRPVKPGRLVTAIGDLACIRLSREKGRRAGRHLTIPLGADGRVVGLMSILVAEGRVMDTGLLRLLTALGEQIGLALDRARLYDELKTKEKTRSHLLAQLITAQEDERRRIARELHDETGQALTALVVNLDFLVRQPLPEDALRQRLKAVRDMAEVTLAEVRRVIHEMRPSVLDDLGLEAAVRWLVGRFEASGLEVVLEFSGLPGRLPGLLEITVFRLIQEACNNSIKHGEAHTLKIRVAAAGRWLSVTVADDGKGMDTTQLSGGSGIGLAGLRERVALIGGQLTIVSSPGNGIRLTAELPLGGALEHDNSSC